MRSQRMPLRERRVFKRQRITHHAQPLHDPLRTLVAQRGECNHFRQPQFMPGKVKCRTRTLCGQTFAPRMARKPPADFHTRSKRQFSRWNMQTYPTDELFARFVFCRPAPPIHAIQSAHGSDQL